MRIIAGSAKGRRLFTPVRSAGRGSIRPTADRAREALFSILGEDVLKASVLDLYAGTGALGLEALSRGAATVLFVDYAAEALALVHRNIEACGFAEASRVVKRDLSQGLALPAELVPTAGFSLVFSDPPYGHGLGLLMLMDLDSGGLLAPGATLVAEDVAKAQYPAELDRLRLFDQRRYGDTGFWLYRAMEAA